MTSPSPITLLSRQDVRKLLKCSLPVLDQLIKTGVVPEPMMFGTRQRWHREALIAHIEKRARQARAA